MWSRDHMYLCIKKEFKDYSVLFLNQIRSARKTIAEFVIYCSFSDSCVQLSGKEKEATMSRTIQKNTQIICRRTRKMERRHKEQMNPPKYMSEFCGRLSFIKMVED